MASEEGVSQGDPITHVKAGCLQERLGGLQTSMYTHIGGRKTQEDRYCICPELVAGEEGTHFYGVFDGTVGDFASNTVKDLVVPYLRNSALPTGKEDTEEKMQILKDAMRRMYQKSDEELLRLAGINEKHYASSTSVTLMLWKDLICVGHLGDSRICLIYVADENLEKLQKDTENADQNAPVEEKTASNDKLAAKKGSLNTPVEAIPLEKVADFVEGNFVTADHKPDNLDERQRIEACGGSVEYLHNHQNKPFIRGGDFQQRKILGESPMQLQYSRAFGGKDLKPFGLLAEPTVNITKRERQFIGFILASDGLWDVLSADFASMIAMKARLKGENPAKALVETALHTSCDNITAVTVFYDTVGGEPVTSA